jgi:molecular chaperone HtpG
MKEGIWEDSEHRKELAPLLRFRSSAVEGLTSLPEYVERMKPEQEAIYILAGDNVDTLARSPQLEGFRARGVEVLLLADPIDAFWPDRFDNFMDKPIRSVSLGAADLAKLPSTEAQGEAPDVSALVAALKEALGDAVSEVRATDRLVESAVVLAASSNGPDLQMQRLLKRAGRGGFAMAPMLEINPRHALIASLSARLAGGADMADSASMLLDLARIQDGEPPRDAGRFARRIEAVLAGEAA